MDWLVPLVVTAGVWTACRWLAVGRIASITGSFRLPACGLTAWIRDELPRLRRGRRWRFAGASAVVCCVAGSVAGGIGGGLAGAFLGLLLAHAIAGWCRRRWLRLFHAQLLVALETTAAGLQAGLSLQQALEGAAGEAELPLRDELGRTVREIRIGGDVDAALEGLAARVESEELGLFVASTSLARQVGGQLGANLRTIAGALRERCRVEEKLESMTAQGRLQAWVVGALPLLLLFAIQAVRPELMAPLARHPFGWALAGTVLVLEAVGFLWMRRLVAPDA